MPYFDVAFLLPVSIFTERVIIETKIRKLSRAWPLPRLNFASGYGTVWPKEVLCLEQGNLGQQSKKGRYDRYQSSFVFILQFGKKKRFASILKVLFKINS